MCLNYNNNERYDLLIETINIYVNIFTNFGISLRERLRNNLMENL